MPAIKCSVGINALSAQEKAALRLMAEQRLPSAVYSGHPYVDAFFFRDEVVLLTKGADEAVTVYFCTDGIQHLYPL